MIATILTDRRLVVSGDELRLMTLRTEDGRFDWAITCNGEPLDQGDDYPTHYDALAAGFERFNFYTPAF